MVAKDIGNVVACASLCCSASLWVAAGLFYAFHPSWLDRFTGFDFFKTTGVGLVLSLISTACKSKLAVVAVPLAALTFFLTMYVMGS
jgi:hypothetical protein